MMSKEVVEKVEKFLSLAGEHLEAVVMDFRRINPLRYAGRAYDPSRPQVRARTGPGVIYIGQYRAPKW